MNEEPVVGQKYIVVKTRGPGVESILCGTYVYEKKEGFVIRAFDGWEWVVQRQDFLERA